MTTVKSIPITIATTASSSGTATASLGPNRQSVSASFGSTTNSSPTGPVVSPSDVSITAVPASSNSKISPPPSNASNRLSENNDSGSNQAADSVRGNQSEHEHEEGTDNEDLSQPLKTTNNNELLALQSSTNDNESKTCKMTI